MTSNLTQLILDNIRLVTIQFNAKLRITQWSGDANRYSQVLISKGQDITECFPVLSGMEDELEQIRLGVIPKLELAKINHERDGKTVYYSMVILPYNTKLVCLLSDVTTTTELEQNLTQQRNELSILYHRLAEQNAKLLELNKIRSAFIAIASHELRSPLSSVYGFLDLVLDGSAGPLNEEQTKFLTIANTGVTRILSLTNDLLDIERIENGKLTLELKKQDLIQIVNQITSQFERELTQRQTKLSITHKTQAYPVLADASRIEQVLTNFISNAIKYSPPGSQVEIFFEEKDGKVFTHIKDNGIGVSEEDQKRLFERFFRARNGAKEARGNGLGLSIVQSIVEKHGGEIQFQSKLGEGSTFSFSLPRYCSPN